jgi:filamentous hemagglutinin family protein
MDLTISKLRNMTYKMTACTFAWSIDMHFKLRLILVSALLSVALADAEVTLDGSVGPPSINSGDPVAAGNGYTYDITADLGEQAGQNLFHSFDLFNIDSGEHANFSGPTSIINIVSRVTGGSSSIGGSITSSISGASLWLVNPAGFIFTDGAVVDVDGTFHLSTADYLEFADRARYFSNLSDRSTLSTGEISSFGFLENSSGAIKITSSLAASGEVDAREHNLSVISDAIALSNVNLYAQEISIETSDATEGDIKIQDSRLETDGGDIFFRGGTLYAVDTVIAGYGREGSGEGATIQLTAPTITFSNVEMRGETEGLGRGSDILLGATTISIGDGSTVDVSSKSTLDNGGDAGTISLSAQNVNITDTEFLLATLGGGAGGSFSIQATNIGLSQTSIRAQTEGLGEAGQISMRGEMLSWRGVAVNASTTGAGIGGSITLSGDAISIDGGSTIESDSFSSGDGGDIIFSATSSFDLTNARIEAEALGSGAGGLVEIKAPEITLGQDSEINISALSGTGDAGVLTLAGTTITAVDADIKGETFGEGKGADIALTAEDITLTGTLINSSTEGVGAGGFIALSADTISIDDGSAIESDSFSSGDGGEIILSATSSFDLTNARIEAEVLGSGAGGLVEIKAPEITLGQDSEINISALSGTGDAGELTIAGTSLILDNSLIATETLTDGNAGQVVLMADTIVATDTIIQGETLGAGQGADISLLASGISLTESIIDSSTLGPGAGGFIRLSGSTLLIDGSTLITETEGTGRGGTIFIAVDQMDILNQGNLNGRSIGGSGDAGSISIATRELNIDNGLITLITTTSGSGGDLVIDTGTFRLNQSTLSASANSDGNAGRIDITADAGTLLNNSVISSDTTGSGVGGDILIEANLLGIFSEAVISSSATGVSDAGDITLIVPDTLQIVRGAIQTTSALSGGGSINIQTLNRIRIDQSIISASANGVTESSGGGNITIDPELFTIRQSQIVAQANAGTGGNIDLVANNFLADTESLISASSQRGIDGTVEIESPNQEVNPISAELNTGFQVLPEFVSSNCILKGSQDRSYLIVDNMNPVRRDPADYLPAPLRYSSAVAYENEVGESGKLLTTTGC